MIVEVTSAVVAHRSYRCHMQRLCCSHSVAEGSFCYESVAEGALMSFGLQAIVFELSEAYIYFPHGNKGKFSIQSLVWDLNICIFVISSILLSSKTK